MFYLVAFYLLVLSIIEHKEPRFLVPILPFCFLMLGYTLATYLKSCPRLIRIYISLFVVVEVAMFIFYHNMHTRQWEAIAHIANKSVAPHSVYTMQTTDAAYYTWTHRKEYLDKEG